MCKTIRQILPGSFRDPSGVVFEEEGVLYREVRGVYRESYDLLMSSGLYSKLVEAGLLVPHQEATLGRTERPEVYRILQPQRVPFVSYPYEWCFSQLKGAALATLDIQKLALEHGMTLKDASAYNIQFLEGRPVLIDTLSFEPYREGAPWVAYRQFCQHFLAPLALMAHRDIRLGQLLRVHLDGVPLDLAATLLPRRMLLRPGMLFHLHLHAMAQRRYAATNAARPAKGRGMSKLGHLALVESLAGTIRRLRWRASGTEWADYYGGDSYEKQAFTAKEAIVTSFLARVRPTTVWDLGANTGHFSKIAGQAGSSVVAFDLDPAATERLYLEVEKGTARHVLPLVLDLTNPSPGIGWANRERMSLEERGPVDMVLALALVHHLAISNNLPLEKVAGFFRKLSPRLAIEFVPKEDPKVQQLLASREDIFPCYTQAGFEEAFGQHYSIEAAQPIPGSLRTLYLMRGKS